MDIRIQFRVDEETKRISHDSWVTEQVNQAFERLNQSTAEFISQEEANIQMEDFKTKVRSRR